MKVSLFFWFVCLFTIWVILTALWYQFSHPFIINSWSQIKLQSTRNISTIITSDVSNDYSIKPTQVKQTTPKLKGDDYQVSKWLLKAIPQNIREVFNPNARYDFYQETDEQSIETQQKLRLKQLHRFCQSAQNKTLGNRSEPTNQVITLMPEFGVMECRVAKTGTTTRGAILWHVFHADPAGEFHPVNNHPVYDKKVKKTVLRDFVSKKSLSSMYPFQYLFTRDPFDRALSAYHDKIVGQKWLGGNMTVDQFFRYLTEPGIRNEHFIDQLSVCNPCLLNLTFLGRQETMMRDIDFIINNATHLHNRLNFNITTQKNEPLFQQNKSDRLKSNEMENLTLDAIFQFIWAFRYDYLAYGYDPYHALRRYFSTIV